LTFGLASAPEAWAGLTVKLVSVTRRGDDPVRHSAIPSISADGRYVAFESQAGNLVPGDHTIRWEDIFVRDTLMGTTVRASVDTEGGDADERSIEPSISADGRYVSFASFAGDLVQGDGEFYRDVFVRDLVTGTTVRASLDMGGGSPNGSSGESGTSISADGRYVAFESSASDLVPGDVGDNVDVFVRDLVAGTTIRVSVDIGGGDPNGHSSDPSISADGRYVAFESYASDLVPGDGNNDFDVFVWDLVAGTTVRASVDSGGGDPNGDSYSPSISADGRYVAFRSNAPDLAQGDGNDEFDVFVRDLAAGTTIRASVDARGGDPDHGSGNLSISADGRYVAFESEASDLVPEDGNDIWDVFVRDVIAGFTVRVSVGVRGGDANGDSYSPSISAEGQYVAFSSWAGNLVPGPGDHNGDVFLARWS
jgi:Tol biopolymer transport system component